MVSQQVTRRQVLSYAFALSAALPLAACSESSETTSTASPASPASASQGGSSDGVFRFAHAAQVNTLDVGQSPSLETRRVSQQILDTLVQPNIDTGAPQPGLAESWEEDDEGTTISFKIREGISFHDGTAFDAQSVVDNSERWKLLATQESAEAAYPYRTLFSAESSAKGFQALVLNVRVADNQVIFTLSRPSTLFLPALTQAAFGIVKPGSWDKTGKLSGNPIGTGPFSLSSWKDSVATLSTNDKYWGEIPSFSGLSFSSIPSADKRFYALMNDQIDAYDQVDKNDFVPLAKSGVITQTRDPFAMVSLNLNLEHPVLSNVYIRRAIAHAIDRGNITDSLFPEGSYDAYSYIPKSLQIPDDDFGSYFSGNLNLAKVLLLRAGYNNEPISFYYPTDTNLTALPHAEAVYANIAEALGKAGLNIKPTPIAYSDGYYEKVAASSTERGISLIEYFGGFRDPMAFIEHLVGALPQGFFDSKITSVALAPLQKTASATATPSPTASAEDTFDPASVEVPELDATPLATSFPKDLLQAMLDADQPGETETSRQKYIEQLKLWCELMPAVPLTFAVSSLAQGKKVSYLPVSSSGISVFNRVALSK